MSPVRFEIDKSHFGRLRFFNASTDTAHLALHSALEQALNTKVVTKRDGLFGPKISRFSYQGEALALKRLDNGDIGIDLDIIDDETREILIEHLKHSFEFEMK